MVYTLCGDHVADANRALPHAKGAHTMTDTERTPDGRFVPGRSGNPSGRPPGSRNKTTLLVEAMIEGGGGEDDEAARRSCRLRPHRGAAALPRSPGAEAQGPGGGVSAAAARAGGRCA